MGVVNGATPTQGVDQIGAFCHVQVRNSNHKITTSLYERDGNYVCNGNGTNDATGRQWLGSLIMNTIFVDRLIDEGFEEIGTEETWIEVIS